ncbi:MAG TPA: hypothetical protein DEH15_14125, partial [Marinilabiliales bacterium]|nr:hypothetical protein [Marinilabiliales bacterium]
MLKLPSLYWGRAGDGAVINNLINIIRSNSGRLVLSQFKVLLTLILIVISCTSARQDKEKQKINR